MKILIVNHYFTPTVGAHVYRWEQIARYWAGQGHSVSVVTGRVADSPDRELLEGVHIVRTGLFAKRDRLVRGAVSGSPSFVQRCKNVITKGMRRIYQFFYWPDGLWHWLPFLCMALTRFRKHEIDLVISYSPTFSAHVGVLLCKRIFGLSNARWVADYGDPFSLSDSMQPNNFWLYRRFNAFVESKVIYAADQVAFTNEQTCEAYQTVYPGGRMEVVPHLVDISLFKSKRVREARSSSLVNLVYVGGFHKGIREPGVMLRFFEHLSKQYPEQFTLNIYGPSNGFDFSASHPSVKYHGAVQRSVAVELIKGADCLVNIDNSNCVMAPSKLVEYVATGRPIINFCGDRPIASVLQDYSRLGQVEKITPSFQEADVARVFEFLMSTVHKAVTPESVDEILHDYDLKVVAGRYL